MHQDPSEHFIVLFEQNCDLKFKRDPFIENNKNIILFNYLFTLKPFFLNSEICQIATLSSMISLCGFNQLN